MYNMVLSLILRSDLVSVQTASMCQGEIGVTFRAEVQKQCTDQLTGSAHPRRLDLPSLLPDCLAEVLKYLGCFEREPLSLYVELHQGSSTRSSIIKITGFSLIRYYETGH